MGWLIGFAGISVPAKPIFQREHARYTIQETGFHAQAGGIQETCCGGTLPAGGKFVVLGIGIHDQRILREEDWRTYLNPPRIDVDELDGHFTLIRWQSDQVELLTDSTGVRTLYCIERTEGVYFSNRLDWLVAYTGPLEIDYSNFGAQWILPNSICTDSMVKGVSRIGPGGSAVIKRGHLTIRSRPWNPSISQLDQNGSSYERTLQKSLDLKGPQAWSLGLSGGLDSRALSALLGSCKTHVWGPFDHPDVQISRKLSRIQGLEQNYFQDELPDITQCIDLIRERVGLTQVITPASAAMERNAYSRLYAMGYGVLDGGFGEIARRQLMNRAVLERILCRDSSNRSLPIPNTGKSDIFAPEIHKIMAHGAAEQFNTAWHELPKSMTMADKADLLSVHSRLPNFFGLEQNYLDQVCVSYMPYAQPSVLRALFQVPLRLRWNGRLLRRLILQHAPSLSKLPLVKGTVQYPFRLGTISSFAYTHLMKRIGKNYHDPRPQAFIHHMEEFVLDTLRSDSVRNYTPYDQTKLRLMADSLASGDTRYVGQLDWWLAFDTWRRILDRPSH
ncbi:MAG: hypothetical protein OXE92_01325 [Bacteroidetes bacterium]|nr:hypothetical protein [Bacteroidota bacterium]